MVSIGAFVLERIGCYLTKNSRDKITFVLGFNILNEY